MKDFSQIEISLFTNFYEVQSSPVTLQEVFNLITGPRLRDLTEHYRATHEVRYKQHTMCVGMALFNGTGKQETDIVRLPGLAMGDFDHLPPNQIEACERLLKADAHAAMVYRTISGEGLRVFYFYDPEMDYHEAFIRGNCYFADLVGQSFDEACSNANRLSALCYDPTCRLNLRAVPFASTEAEVKRPSGRQAPDESLIDFAVRIVERRGTSYVEGSRNVFLMRCLMFMNRLGVPRSDAEQWATGYDLPGREVMSIIKSCYKHTENHGTWTSKDRKPGAKKTRARSAVSPKAIAAFLSTQALFRMNEISDRTEICWIHEQKDCQWRPLTDRDVSTLWTRMCNLGIEGKEQHINSVIQSDFTPLFNPFLAYFERLKPWDGETDHIGELASRVHLVDETPELHHHFTECLRKWLVAMVAGIVRADVVNHEILVFIGRQGNFKSTFFANLLPPELQRYFYAKLYSDLVTKDDLFTLTQYAIICFDEIDVIRDSGLNRIKAMTTMRDINERRAYGRHKEHRPHIASFCATGNNIQFLSDRTGNRRWLPFEIDWILSPLEQPFDYEGIYSQAWALLESGFSYWFTKDDIAQLNEHNSHFEAPCLEEELIMQHFCIPEASQTIEWVSTANILEIINGMLRQPLTAAKIGIAMKRLGFKSMHTKTGARYQVHVRSFDEQQAIRRM